MEADTSSFHFGRLTAPPNPDMDWGQVRAKYLGYSLNPWRLVTDDGLEVAADGPNGLSIPVDFRTRSEAEQFLQGLLSLQAARGKAEETLQELQAEHHRRSAS